MPVRSPRRRPTSPAEGSSALAFSNEDAGDLRLVIAIEDRRGQGDARVIPVTARAFNAWAMTQSLPAGDTAAIAPEEHLMGAAQVVQNLMEGWLGRALDWADPCDHGADRRTALDFILAPDQASLVALFGFRLMVEADDTDEDNDRSTLDLDRMALAVQHVFLDTVAPGDRRWAPGLGTALLKAQRHEDPHDDRRAYVQLATAVLERERLQQVAQQVTNGAQPSGALPERPRGRL